MAASAAVPSHAARTEVCPGVPPRTKIVATLGPASDGRVLNFWRPAWTCFALTSRTARTPSTPRASISFARSARLGRYVAIMADLQGPKIRIQGFAQPGPVALCRGACFAIDAALTIYPAALIVSARPMRTALGGARGFPGSRRRTHRTRSDRRPQRARRLPRRRWWGPCRRAGHQQAGGGLSADAHGKRSH